MMTTPGLPPRDFIYLSVEQGRFNTDQLKQGLALVWTGLGEGRSGDFCTYYYYKNYETYYRSARVQLSNKF